MWKWVAASYFVCSLGVAAVAAPVEEIFASAFVGEPQIYRPGQCGRNVFELARLFQQEGVALRDGEVLFFLKERRMVTGIPLVTTLVPAAARGGISAWEFHVVLVAPLENSENAKQVFDLDWQSRSAPVADYIASMFPNKSGDRYEKIWVRSFPLNDYLQMLAEKSGSEILKTVGELRVFEDSRYPVETLHQYLVRTNSTL